MTEMTPDNPPQMPKIEYSKIVVPLAVMFLTKNVPYFDFAKNPDGIRPCQGALVAVTILVLTIHYYIYTLVNNNSKKDIKIAVPPKAAPQLFGPPAEAPTEDKYTKTTYKEYEIGLLRESGQSLLFNIGFAMFMSFKMNIHFSMIMSVVNVPLNFAESAIFRKYILGITTKSSGLSNIYDEKIVETNSNENPAKIASTASESTSVNNVKATGSVNEVD